MSKSFSDPTPEVFHTLAEKSVDAIAIVDPEGKMTYGNRACYELFGYDYEKEEIRGLPTATFWPEEDIPLLSEEVLPQAMAGSWRGEVRLKRKDGGLFDAYLAMFGLTDEAGQPMGAAAIIRDITERKRAEEELAEERNLLRTVIDNLPHYIYVKDTKSRFVIGNIAVAGVMGATTPDELIGKTDFDFYPQELAAQYYADEQEIMRSGQPLLNREEPLMDQVTGRKGWLLTTKVPLRDSEGKIVGFVGIGRDITERKRAQEVIEAQRQALRELSTPIVPVLEDVLVLPLVGSIDTGRAQQIMETLLEAIGRHQAEVMIIDITGVPVVDTGVANHLLQVTRAAALLGAECVLVGISPDVAQTIVSLGVELSGIATRADLQAGIEHALEMTGKKIVLL